MKSITYILSFFLFSFNVFAQTVTLPDINLVNKLKEDYPQVMQGDELLLAEAANLTGGLNVSGANITDATGIEHFTSITSLRLSFNQLSSIPDISSITGLSYFYADHNQLTSLPDMSSMSQLTDFQVHNNSLTELPTLPSSIVQVYSGNNQLNTLPDLASLPNLEVLVIGNNPLEQTIDFGRATNLKQLHVHQTGLDSIIGLAKLEQLTTLYAWGNNISNFSAIDSITTLNTCVISDNPLQNLPYFENKPDLNYLDITNNYLSFEDLLPLFDGDTPMLFFYAPQRDIFIQDHVERALSSVTFTSPVDDNVTTNTYVWKKNNTVLDSSSSNSFTINSLAEENAGEYTLTIYNSELTEITLHSNSFELNVLPCMELVSTVEVLDQNCTEGYTISLENNNITGGVAPFEFHLQSSAFEVSAENSETKEVPAGAYTLEVTDARGCVAESQFTLDRIENCDPVFSPNGDGYADTYFIKEEGTVKIYDVSRNLITELQAPTTWDGTTKDGAPLDAGYYILIVEDDKVINLTLVR